MENMFQPSPKSVKPMISIYRPPKLFQLQGSQIFFFCCLIYTFPTSDQMTPWWELRQLLCQQVTLRKYLNKLVLQFDI